MQCPICEHVLSEDSDTVGGVIYDSLIDCPNCKKYAEEFSCGSVRIFVDGQQWVAHPNFTKEQQAEIDAAIKQAITTKAIELGEGKTFTNSDDLFKDLEI